jgi:CoA:oxalate CoA-transferase
MKSSEKSPQVFSKHMTGKKTQEHLANFERLLSEMIDPRPDKTGSLENIRVLEVSSANYPATICASMLGELGAEVLKIEPPEGDPAREVTPYGVNIKGVGLPFLMENRNKRNITMDLSTETGRANLKKLAGGADVLIDAMKPGELDAIEAGYRHLSDVNPSLIYVAVSPFGHFTSKAERCRDIPDSDLTAQAESGFSMLIGDPREPEPYNYPLRAGIWAASYMSGALATAGTLTALLHRNKTGEGQMVDIATNDAISAWQGFSAVWGFTMEQPRVRIGNFDWGLYPYGYYKAKDGYVTVCAALDHDFRGLLKILGRWDLEDDWKFLFDRLTDDPEKLQELETEIEKEIAKYTCDELFRKTFEYGIKATRDKLRSKGFPIVVETKLPHQVVEEKHWQIRKSFQEVDVPGFGKITIPASPPQMSESPMRIKWIKGTIGEDDEEIYAQYGLEK